MKRAIALAAAAAAIVLGVALYGIGGPDGNGEAQACTAGVETAKAIEPLAGGEIAAFQLARKPVDLSQIAYTNADGAATTPNRGVLILLTRFSAPAIRSLW